MEKGKKKKKNQVKEQERNGRGNERSRPATARLAPAGGGRGRGRGRGGGGREIGGKCCNDINGVVHVICEEPLVMFGSISLPTDQVLSVASPAEDASVQDGVNLKFVGTVNSSRWTWCGSGVTAGCGGRGDVRFQFGDVEDRVNSNGGWQFEVVVVVGEDGLNLEGA